MQTADPCSLTKAFSRRRSGRILIRHCLYSLFVGATAMHARAREKMRPSRRMSTKTNTRERSGWLHARPTRAIPVHRSVARTHRQQAVVFEPCHCIHAGNKDSAAAVVFGCCRRADGSSYRYRNPRRFRVLYVAGALHIHKRVVWVC